MTGPISPSYLAVTSPVGHFHRERAGELAEADIVEQFMNAAVEAVAQGLGASEVEGASVLALQHDP